MKFSLKILLCVVAVFALVMLGVVCFLPQPPAVPACIGKQLSDEEVKAVLKRYGTNAIIAQDKSTVYSNADMTCQIEVFDNHVVRVELAIPLDTSLNIDVSTNASGVVDEIEYVQSATGSKRQLCIIPSPDVRRRIYGNISYTVRDK